MKFYYTDIYQCDRNDNFVGQDEYSLDDEPEMLAMKSCGPNPVTFELIQNSTLLSKLMAIKCIVFDMQRSIIIDY